MGIEAQHAQREAWRANVQLVRGGLTGLRVDDGCKAEQFGRDPDGLLAAFVLDDGTAAELVEVACIRAFPLVGAVAQDLAGHLRQPGREAALELAVLLIDGGERAGVAERLACRLVCTRSLRRMHGKHQ